MFYSSISTVTVHRADQDITVEVAYATTVGVTIREALDEDGHQVELTPKEVEHVRSLVAVGYDETGR